MIPAYEIKETRECRKTYSNRTLEVDEPCWVQLKLNGMKHMLHKINSDAGE